MTEWLLLIGAVILATALMWLPGWCALRAFGWSNTSALAVAPPISIAMISGGAFVCELLGVPWNPLVLLVSFLIEILIVLGICLLFKRFLLVQNDSELTSAWKLTSYQLLAAALPGAVIIAIILIIIIGHPDSLSQTFDSVYHYNAVRYIIDHEEASPFTISRLNYGPSASGNYPVGWHTFVAVIATLINSNIPVAVNATNLVVAALVWPVGTVCLASYLWPKRAYVALSAGILSGSFSAFPYALYNRWPLFPNALAFALVPAVLTLIIRLIMRKSSLGKETAFNVIVVLMIAFCGVIIAHPNAFMMLILLGTVVLVVITVESLIRRRGTYSRRFLIRNIFPTLIVLTGTALLWSIIRPSSTASPWPPIQSLGQAVGEVVTNAYSQTHIEIVLSVFMMIGLIGLIRERKTIVVIIFATTSFLYIVVTGLGYPALRFFLSGVFYNDSFRVAAACATPVVLLASYGLSSFLNYLTTKGHPPVYITAVLLSLTLFLILPLRPNFNYGLSTFGVDKALLLDPDEFDVIQHLDAYTTPSDRLLVDPATGGAFAYALADREVVGAHYFFEDSPSEDYVRHHIQEGKSPQLCSALEDSGITYVLDFGKDRAWVKDQDYPTIPKLPRSIVDSVYERGHARLLRITACER